MDAGADFIFHALMVVQERVGLSVNVKWRYENFEKALSSGQRSNFGMT